MAIYDKIKEKCTERNMTIMELEKRAGLGNGAIGKWRKTTPKVDSLMKAAKTLDVPIESLLED